MAKRNVIIIGAAGRDLNNFSTYFRDNDSYEVTAFTATQNPDGELMEMAKANLCVGYHYFLDDDTIDPFFALLRKRSNRPFVLAQDLMVINVTPEQVVTRMAQTSLLHWPPPAPLEKQNWELGSRSNAAIPAWLAKTKVLDQAQNNP